MPKRNSKSAYKAACNAAGGMVARILLNRPFEYAVIYKDNRRIRSYIHVSERITANAPTQSQLMATESDATDEMIALLAQYTGEDLLDPREYKRLWRYQRKLEFIPAPAFVLPSSIEGGTVESGAFQLERLYHSTYRRAWDQACRFLPVCDADSGVDRAYESAFFFLGEAPRLSIVRALVEMLTTTLDVSGASGIRRVITFDQAKQLVAGLSEQLH